MKTKEVAFEGFHSLHTKLIALPKRQLQEDLCLSDCKDGV